MKHLMTMIFIDLKLLIMVFLSLNQTIFKSLNAFSDYLKEFREKMLI
jgi:hypothetical protein